MSLTNPDTLISSLGSPLNIASMAIDEFEDRSNGKVITGANNPFCFLVEFAATINASAITAMDEKLPILYPARARSMSDLFAHMSDYDFLRMYSTPSQMNLRMTLPKKYLLEYALDYNENYKQVTLPKDAVFRIGNYLFGLYYPINILINNFTKSFTVVYDTTSDNPLFALARNVVEKYDTHYHGIDYLVMDFPIYQFAKSVTEESLIAETGFTKNIIYNNKFYALRIFHYKDGEYHELGQSQSEAIYDISRPTALVRVMPDDHKVNITIPQIYFDQGIIGSKLSIEVYTTYGALDIDVTKVNPTSIQANFGLKSRDATEFSRVFKSLPFDLIMSISSTKLTGGSNAITVDTLRDRVVNDTLYEKAPITEKEIEVYLEDNGFYTKKYLDNVTDRIYHAYRVLEDGTGSVIPSITLNMRMLSSYVDDRPTFLMQVDNSITVLPTTLYKYNEAADDVVPITQDEIKVLAQSTKQEMVDLLNTEKYFRSPFHMRVDLNDFFPETESFNLMIPEIRKLIFDEENYNVSAKMMVYDARITHLNDGTGGYLLEFSVFKSDDLKDVPKDKLIMHCMVKSSNGTVIGRQCDYLSSTAERDIYGVNLGTNYHLTKEGEITLTNFMLGDDTTPSDHQIDLITDFDVVFLVHRDSILGEYQDAPQTITHNVPTPYLFEHVALSRQHISVKLGHSLNDVIYNKTEVTVTPKVYAVWDTDIEDYYTQDIYERDSTGALVYTIVGGVPVLNKLHQIGDMKIDDKGLPIYKHKVGDIKLDASGNPIEILDRDKIFYIETMLLDAKVFASERTAEMDFVAKIHDTIEGYLTVIRNLQSQLLERTHLYFKCVRSTGSSKVNIGDGVIQTQDVEMDFSIVAYVPSFVKNDETIQSTIRDKTCAAIEEAIRTKTISMLDIFDEVKSKMPDYIDHITLLGTNGDLTNQTFVLLNEDAQASIARKLELSEDNIISLVKQIHIDFVAFDDNTSGNMEVEV